MRISTIHSFCWSSISHLALKILRYSNPTIENEFKPDASLSTNFMSSQIQSVEYNEGIPQFRTNTGELYLSHNDVINLFIYALKNIAEFRTIISDSLDFLLIDEYQDTNGLFLKSIFKYLSDNCTIGLYGDPCQEIYLDSDSINLSEYKDLYKITSMDLNNNFRSREKLVEFFNKYRKNFDDLNQSHTISGGTKPYVFAGDGPLNRKKINDIENIIRIKNETILSLTNGLRTEIDGFKPIAKKLKKCIPDKNIPWNEVMNPNLNSYINTISDFAKIFQDNNFLATKSLLKFFTTASLKKSDFDAIKNKINLKKNDISTDTGLLLYLDLELKKEFNPLKDILNSFNINELSKITEFYNEFDNTNQNNITIYKAKGLEFNNVILNIDYGYYMDRNWDKINFEHKETDSLDIKSNVMNYLFYVGITRAKNNLIIYINNRNNHKFLEKFAHQFPSIDIVKV